MDETNPPTGSVWRNVRAVWGVLNAGERRNWLSLVPLGLLAALVEVACAGAVFGLVARLSDPTATSPSWLGEFGGVVSFAVIAGVLFLFKTGVTLALVHANHRAVERGRAAVAGRLYARALDAPWTLHLERGLVQAAHDLLGRSAVVFDAVVGPAAQIAVNGVMALALLGVMLVAAPVVTLVVGASLAVWLSIVHRLSRRLADRAGVAEDEAGRAVLADVWQGLGALREIRSLGRERFFHDRFMRDQSRLVRARYQRATLASMPRVWTETLFVLVMLGVVLALRDQSDPASTFGLLGLSAYVALRLLPMANGTAWHLGQIRWATPAVAQLVAESSRPAPRWPNAEVAPVTQTGAGVSLTALNYTWPGAERPTLRDVSLHVAPGESLAIEGETGAGKSTLLANISGLVAPDSGAVEIAGAGPREATVRMGYVPQEVVLLTGTITDNVALGVNADEVDEARLLESLRVACLDEFVAGLPAGRKTAVGEAGARLSGGERQRLALARALYHQPAVLLLDEATAALDATTEARVIERLTKATRGRCTLIVVTHRPQAATACDRRVRVERDGRVHESAALSSS